MENQNDLTRDDTARAHSTELGVFILWSGERSRVVAEALHAFLKSVCQGPTYFMSKDSVRPGEVWQNVIQNKLGSSPIGIACITPENKNSNWIHFESGAIAHGAGTRRVMIYRIGIDQHQIEQPLG